MSNSETTYKKEVKAIKLLQDRSSQIEQAHSEIGNDLQALRKQLDSLGAEDVKQQGEYEKKKQDNLDAVSHDKPLPQTDLSSIYTKAESRYNETLGLKDILKAEDWVNLERKLDQRIIDFNRRYELDSWDYAIAGSCGLFAAMLDLLCVRAPLKPTASWAKKVDGIFSQQVQKTFNKLIPPELSDKLSKVSLIGSPDTSVTIGLIGAPSKTLNPVNHRLRSLAHDPILGFMFGAWDMLHGTCTVVVNGEISSIPTTKGSTDGNVFQLLGRMLGHLLSDVNAPSGNMNRGMGLPAPFMGLLRMLEGIPVGSSSFGKQVEWMYVNGYDTRQFVATSIPMAIMEVVLRVFYVTKQMKQHDAPFGETLMDTMPLRMNPRFRMILALAYGTSSAVNAGKMHITQNILNANYASWMGLAWHGLHSLKWAMLDKHLKLWGEIESKEITELEVVVKGLDGLKMRAMRLPT